MKPMVYYYQPHGKNTWESTTDWHEAYIRASGGVYPEYVYKVIVAKDIDKIRE